MYSFEDYKWNLNPCLVKIMCADNTHVRYLTDKQLEQKKAIRYGGNNNKLVNDLGIPIIGGDKN